MVADLIDRLVSAAQADPGMHVYHYAPYEVTALKKLTGGYGVREAELDQLLREERFVDLYPVVRQSMRISKESYSIKKVEAFYGRSHRAPWPAGWAACLYEQWLVDRDARSWPRSSPTTRRTSTRPASCTSGWSSSAPSWRRCTGAAAARADHFRADPTVTDAQAAELELAARLHDAGHELLGDLVGWHRREDRPAWWEVPPLADLDAEELSATARRWAGCPSRYVGPEKKSHLYEYSFPVQDTKVSTARRSTSTPRRRSARSSSSTRWPGGWC